MLRRLIFNSSLFWLALEFAAAVYTPSARADDLLPYDTRTRPYGGWATPAKGDIRTVGMAGATTGLADTFIAATSNPAGLALTLKDADTNFSTNKIHNSYIQDYDNVFSTANYGAALDLEPWGFSVGYVQPYREGQNYVLPVTGNPIGDLNVTIRELDFSFARLFRDILPETSLSVGAELTLGQGEEEIDVGSASNAYHSYSVGGTLGVLLKLPRRFLIGLSYSTDMRYDANEANLLTPTPLNGFYQPIDVPARLNLGVGWIPNRYFRLDIDLQWIGATPDAAVLRDQTISIGNRNTIQPKVGFAYTAVDYKEFQSTAFFGGYYEMTRIDGTDSRPHFTTGIEFKPWIFTVGWGIDTAPDYLNYLFGFGVDIVRLAEKLDFLPPLPHAPHSGFLPNPQSFSDDGLAKTLVSKDAEGKSTTVNPIDIGLGIPKRIGEKVHDIKEAITGTSPTPTPQPEKSPVPKKKKAKHKKKPKKKPKKVKRPDPEPE